MTQAGHRRRGDGLRQRLPAPMTLETLLLVHKSRAEATWHQQHTAHKRESLAHKVPCSAIF